MAFYEVSLGGTLRGFIDSTIEGKPTAADKLPTYSIDGPSGAMANGQGQASKLHSGNVSNAANNGSGLIRITTDAAHNLTTGARVTLASVGGVSNANGTHTITKVDATNFDLDDSTFAGSYTSGGTWEQSGAYVYEHTIDSADGYAVNTMYRVSGVAVIDSTGYKGEDTFKVV